MKKHIPKSFRQIFAVLLCLTMLVPMVPLAVRAEGASVDTFTILAGSDFQAFSDASNTAASTYDRAEQNMSAIMDQVVKNHQIDGFLFCGDYSSVSYDSKEYCLTGYNRLMDVLASKGVTDTLKEEDMFFVQGNHDAVADLQTNLPFIRETTGFEREQYSVYVLNYKDYNSETQNPVTVTNTATNLKRWLAKQEVGTKPIFVISHVPLHHSVRAYEKGDAQYAQYIVDVLNEAGARGLNIIFLYGHNHAEKNTSSMGGSTNFVARGEDIWVPNTAGTKLAPSRQTIQFTYMNAGFVGWFGNNKEAYTDDLTMSVFEISGDDVTITRYSKDGVFPLQEKAGTFYNDAEATYGYTPDTIVQASPLKVQGAEDLPVVDHSGKYFYRLANKLEHGKHYVIADSKAEGLTSIVWEWDGNLGKLYTNMNPHIAVYNSAAPYLLIEEASVSTQNEMWTFSDPDGDGYGTLTGENGTCLGFANMVGTKNNFVEASLFPANGVGADTLLWTYVDEGNGKLESNVKDHTGKNIQLTHFAHTDGRDYWAAVSNSNFDTRYFSGLYIYERTPLTYTLSLSDSVGEAALNGTETGTMIVKTWATGQIEYIPLTVDMLSRSSASAGTFTGVTVTYEGTVISTDYTLVVGGGNTITVEEGYYYRLTDQFAEGRNFNEEKQYNYLILSRNDQGQAALMESDGFSDHGAMAVDVVVTLDADGVPSVLSGQVTRPTYQEWWKHKHSDNVWYLWQPNYTGAGNGSNNYFRVNIAPYYTALTGRNDAHAMTAPSMVKSTSYLSSTCSNYTTIRGVVNAFGKQMYVQYYADTNQFKAVPGESRREGQEVYIYEKVIYTTATVSLAGNQGTVSVGSAEGVQTGTEILITYPDGRVESVQVTANMLYRNGKALTGTDLKNAGKITGLTLKYQGATVTADYTLVIRAN